MGYNSTRSPGGWFQADNIRVSRKVKIGVVGTALGVLTIFGVLQGRQASHWVEVDLDPVTYSGSVIEGVLNPLGETGAVMFGYGASSYVFFDEVPAPASRLLIGVGDSASESGSTIAEITPADDVIYSLAGSGAVNAPDYITVGPNQYITFTWYNGTGATVAGGASGVARIEIEPLGTATFTAD